MKFGKYTTLIRLLVYSDLFEDAKLEFRKYLYEVPPEFIIQTSVHLLTSGDKYAGQRLHRFFNASIFRINDSRIDKILEKYIAVCLSESGYNIAFANAPVSLKLIEFALEQESKNKCFKKKWTGFMARDYRINYFKAYLALNQEIRELQDIQTYKYRGLSIDEGIFRLTLSQALPIHDLTDFNLSVTLKCELFKAARLFDFLEKDYNCQKLLESFFDFLGVKNKVQVYKKILMIAQGCFRWLKDDPTFIILKDNAFEKNSSFVKKFVLKDLNESSSDYKMIKDKPFYQLEVDRYLIIHSLFTIQKLYKSLYFTLNEVNKLLPKSQQVSKNFRSYYGQNFSENYLISSILAEILASYNTKLDGEYIRKEFGSIGEPDYYAKDNDSIFLVETKDSLFNSDVKCSFDFDLIEKETRKKLFGETIGGHQKNKTILQLVRIIEKIQGNVLEFDQYEEVDNYTIFSVHIFHDEAFNTPGMNYMVNRWFQEEIEKRRLNNLKVIPIILISVDTLIHYYEIFKLGKMNLKCLLSQYADQHLLKSTDSKFSSNLSVSFSTFLKDHVNKYNLNQYLDMTLVIEDIESLTGWRWD